MRSICLCLVVIAACVSAVVVNEPGNPITSYTTSTGRNGIERVTHLEAVIRTDHVGVSRRSFGTDINHAFALSSNPGDERGHLLGSQFSGPPVLYNLGAQTRQVNRNVGFESVLDTWYGEERKVRTFLDMGGDRKVNWKVDLLYNDDSNRPSEYRLDVEYFLDGKAIRSGDYKPTYLPLPNRDNIFLLPRNRS